MVMIGKYELNNIYNEDSYKAIKNIPDNSVDCIYTDVPYLYQTGGVGSSSLGSRMSNKRKELQNISKGIDMNILDEFVRISKKVNMIIWGSEEQIFEIVKHFEKYKKRQLFWVKTNPSPTGNCSWLPDVEFAIHVRESGTTMNNGYHLKSKWYKSPLNKKDKDLFKHPTIKPLDLVKRHLEHVTNEGDIVVDFFLGSGTTCVAAKELGRKYLGFEIDKEYYEIAKDRLNGITATGQTSIFTNFD